MRLEVSAGEGVVPGVPAYLHHPDGEGGLGAGQLDGGQLPVHLQIHSHSKGILQSAFGSSRLLLVVTRVTPLAPVPQSVSPPPGRRPSCSPLGQLGREFHVHCTF